MLGTNLTVENDTAGPGRRPIEGAVPTAQLLARLTEQHPTGPDGRCLTCLFGVCPGRQAATYLNACDHGSAWTGGPPPDRSTTSPVVGDVPGGHDWYLLRGLLHCGPCRALFVADWFDGARSYRCSATCRPSRLVAQTVEDDTVATVTARHPTSRWALDDYRVRHHALRQLVDRVVVEGGHRLTVIWRA